VKQTMLTEAAGHLQEAINIHPTYKNAYLLLGNCYNYLKQYDQAIASYRKALELDPGYEEAFTNLKVTLQQAGRFYGEEQGDLARAIQYLEQAYQMDANDYETVRLLGVAYGVGGNVQRAIEYFTKGVELAPNNAGAWYDLGSAYYNAQMPEQGNAYIQKALEINPNIVQERQQ
jgi:tetratricopeptide (TPR) repeat protein